MSKHRSFMRTESEGESIGRSILYGFLYFVAVLFLAMIIMSV